MVDRILDTVKKDEKGHHKNWCVNFWTALKSPPSDEDEGDDEGGDDDEGEPEPEPEPDGGEEQEEPVEAGESS